MLKRIAALAMLIIPCVANSRAGYAGAAFEIVHMMRMVLRFPRPYLIGILPV